ncbi:MAG: flippase-like domain-containing protein [Phycicoccus sp.]|nr:flippase-like domain-containing protein [Phycicoccus sp.]
MSSRIVTIARLLLPSTGAVVVIVVAIPAVAAASWDDITTTLGRLDPLVVVGLTALWVAGLVAQTPTLTAALPGLSHRRALALNLSGSCVSNLLPLGGAAGTAVNWRMVRGWGFGAAAFARWALVTNLADTAVKLALPAVVLGWFAVSADAPPHVIGTAALAGAALLIVLIALIGVGSREATLRRVGGWLDGCAERIAFLPRSREGYAADVVRFRTQSAELIIGGWPGLLGGKLAYAILQAALLWGCLAAVGVQLPLVVVAAAFVVERVLSLLVLTPGAVGPVEVGMVAALTALGAPSAAAAAGVLLYRAFIVALEIPVGGAVLVGWWAQRQAVRRMPRRTMAPSRPVPPLPGSAITTR